MSSLSHAVGFLQAAYTIVLGLALTEGFKQFVPDRDEEIDWDRFWPLFGFVFLIFPFFHGMSRYLYTTYLLPKIPPNSGH
jgi:dolichyl-phosphate-mannose--protein O-mannosyl transferase